MNECKNLAFYIQIGWWNSKGLFPTVLDVKRPKSNVPANLLPGLWWYP